MVAASGLKIMSSGFLNPPQWDEKNKDFNLWLREVEAWKCATANVTGLKDVHGLQLALHLPEGSEIRRQVFDTLELDELKGVDGWKSLIDLLKTHYAKDDSSAAFDTWREFRNLSRNDKETIDQYIMRYEQYKGRMKRYKMNLGENIHGLNLLCGANLTDDELRIAMREVDGDKPEEMYKDAKKSLRKYFGNAGITNATTSTSAVKLVKVKQESSLFADSAEYETFLAWKSNKYNNTKNNYSRNSDDYENFNSSRNDRGRFNRYPVNQGDQFTSKRPSNKFCGAMNPRRNGFPLQCRVCCSIGHFEKECPQNSQNDKTTVNNDNIKPTYITETIFDCKALDLSAGDAYNYMILDTGCPQNVAGQDWVECFLDSFDNEKIKLIKRFPSTNKFKFGGGVILSSLYQIEVPIVISGSSVNLRFDVVENELPLLLGKKTMKEWNVVIHTKLDTAEFKLGNDVKKVDLYTSKSGHWCINISPCLSLAVIHTLFSVTHLSLNEKQSAASRLHRQFCHPPFSFLKKVLNLFDGVDNEFLEILERFSSNCRVCKRYKRTNPRPAVGNLFDPDKMKFNQIVSIDLKERSGRWIMYMIDVVTRYTRAEFISTKEKKTVIEMIIKMWMSIFGAAEIFLMDNGGEFANDEMRELGNQFGIFIKHTAAYAPWANGLNERNHASIDIMMEKMLEDSPEESEELALQYAVSIRNCCMYVHGFTPAQLAIGQNPRLPSAFNDKLPALEGTTTSPIIAEHLNTIANARKAFVLAETSNKLRKALKHPVRSHNDIFYNQGDVVFFQPPNMRRWEGPATVIGRDGKVVIIKHGSVIRRVHPCRLQFVNDSDQGNQTPQNDVADLDTNKSLPDNVTNIPDLNINIDNEPASIDNVANSNNSNNNVTHNIHNNIVDDNHTSENESTDTEKIALTSVTLPKKGEEVKYKYPSEDWKDVTVLGRAGTARGKNKYWLNVSDGIKAWSMDWSDVESWEYVNGDEEGIPNEVIEVNVDNDLNEVLDEENEIFYTTSQDGSNQDDSDIFLRAKDDELQKWKLFNVYTEVPDNGQKYLSGRWVCSEKCVNENVTRKARFVVKGFQERSSIQSDSPTGSKECMRLILVIIVSKQWTLNSCDVTAAFLQGSKMEREIYLKTPLEAHRNNILWKLEKCVYGLNDAARMWYFAVCKRLEELGCKRSSVDYGVFMLHKCGELLGILIIHVDDFLWTGSKVFEKEIIDPLCTTFSVGKESNTSFTHLGLKLEQNSNYIYLDQIEYINSKQEVHLSRDRQSAKKQICDETEGFLYRQLVGRLNWIAAQSRPDIAFSTCLLSSSTKHPKVEDIFTANKVLRKIKEQPLKLAFPKLEGLDGIKIVCYSDASLANLPSGRSTGAYFLFLSTSDDKCCPILWRSYSIKRVVRSSLAAETSALIDGLDAAYFLATMIEEMLFGESPNSKTIKIPIVAFTDNESLYNNAYSTTMVKEHRLRIDMAIIKEMLEKRELMKLEWIPSFKQIADCLTKRGANSLTLTRILENGYFSF